MVMTAWQHERLRNAIADRLVEIEDLVRGPVLVTCVVRTPGEPGNELVVTNDTNMAEIVATIERRWKAD